MSIETVRVTPGMLPPTMSTTPNSPMVWAKLRTTPVTTPAIDNGNVTRTNVANRDIPSVHEASTSFGSTAPKADVKGRSEEHTSELQSLTNLVCRLLLE